MDNLHPLIETVSILQEPQHALAVLHGVLEVVVKITVVQEHIRVVEPSVEMPLDGFERLDHAVDLLVSSQNDECGVGSLAFHLFLDLTASRRKDFIVLFADFPVVGEKWMG